MGADQVAAIRPMIAELEDAKTAEPNADYFASFTVAGKSGLWVEVIIGTINMAYPFSDDPLARLTAAGVSPLPGLSLDSWQPKVFAAFAYQHSDARPVAVFVDSLFEKVLSAGANYPIDTAISKLHA